MELEDDDDEGETPPASFCNNCEYAGAPLYGDVDGDHDDDDGLDNDNEGCPDRRPHGSECDEGLDLDLLRRRLRPFYVARPDPVLLQCQMCLRRRKAFYCQACVSGGHFTPSARSRWWRTAAGQTGVTMAELKVRFRRAEETVSELRTRRGPGRTARQDEEGTSSSRSLNSNHWQELQLEDEIRLCQQRIKYLQSQKAVVATEVASVRQASANWATVNDKRVQRLPMFKDKVDKMSSCATQYFSDLKQEFLKVQGQSRALCATRKAFLQDIRKTVFPIIEVDPWRRRSSSRQQQQQQNREPPDSVSQLLVEAMSTSFVQGRWVTTSSCDLATAAAAAESGGPRHHKIVEAMLPSDGDYSAYPALVAAMNDQSMALVPTAAATAVGGLGPEGGGGAAGRAPQALSGPVCEIHTLSAGLTFACQLTGLLSSVLDVVLPKRRRLHFSDFSAPISSDLRFAKLVSRLNINVLALCLSQEVPAERLHPCRTLHNLRLLLGCEYPAGNQTSQAKQALSLLKLHDLSVEVAADVTRLAGDSNASENSDDDEFGGDGSPYLGKNHRKEPSEPDWESVPSDLMVVTLPHNSALASRQPAYYPASVSGVASSFMTSLMRGLTGGASAANPYYYYSSSPPSKKS